MRALVIGGTGPTGIHVVRGLVDRGYEVTIMHRGLHERAETPPQVVHLHHDPYDADDLRSALGATTFDVVVRDVRPPAQHRRAHGRPLRSVRVGRRRSRVSRVDESVARRAW